MILSCPLGGGRWILKELHCVACDKPVKTGGSFAERWFVICGEHIKENEMWRIGRSGSSVATRHAAIRSSHSCSCGLRLFITVKTACDYNVIAKRICGSVRTDFEIECLDCMGDVPGITLNPLNDVGFLFRCTHGVASVSFAVPNESKFVHLTGKGSAPLRCEETILQHSEEGRQ